MSTQTASDAVWVVLGVAACGAVVASHLPRTRLVHLSTVVRRLEDNAVAYVAVLLSWMWLGWHCFAR